MADGLPIGEALDRGLAWLFTTVHPDGSTVNHLGDSLLVEHNRRLGFVPAGSRSGRAPVITLEVAAPRARPQAKFNELSHYGLAPHELDALTALLAERGHQVVDRWNGFPATGGSLALGGTLHPSMQAARDSYHQGCAAHGGSVFCNCPLWREGFGRLVPLRDRREAVLL